ncbi:MAG TPA: chorismate mutase [Rubrobacteraceae bacterium]
MRPPEACESLEDVRGAIDGLDREVLRLLGSRARYVATAARFKTDPKGVRAPERQRAMLARRRDWAGEEGLDPDLVEELYGRIVSHFVGREMDHWQGSNA